MHIYEDGKEVEKVDIYELTKHDEIVKKMKEKGFQLKSSQEILKERLLTSDLAKMEASSLFGMSTVYMTVGAIGILFLAMVVRGRTKGRKSRNVRKNDLIV
mmetsp:Transcript_32431/g.78762  ORF Transcript_32431/g.78762 Transcript_32431/m.78762 type:complete len:101 (-) Transcript_32431:397-699(-)|eukprot:CAMPEP_0113605508 /NCGR_PEP_ID=MMETSP0017_2-20120614/2365_1 /TAXON_ID=2856 /ORGANISM="Cylindrotheca closterium" /LENGTH=100 /DNA_ID=CAMNT_0000514003 /DNA_START=215 /DNA_END=517 /DNA_ORIENTATION=+ /assembly_acc=CAM_ASM_000147